jgi:hypothetical protein
MAGVTFLLITHQIFMENRMTCRRRGPVRALRPARTLLKIHENQPKDLSFPDIGEYHKT